LQAQAQCLPVDIALDTTVQGSLAPGDCTIEQLGIDPGDTSLVDVYRVTLNAAGFLTVDLQSAVDLQSGQFDFDTFLWVFDEAISTLISLDDDLGDSTDDLGDSTNSLVDRVHLPAGVYVILANSWNPGETGAYDLTTTVAATGNPACDVVVDLSPNASVDGTLTPDDCTLAQLGLDTTLQASIDQYRVRLPSGGPLTVALDSDDVDSFLQVRDETTTNLIAEDDDGGDIPNSLIMDLPLDPGTYVIFASSFDPGEIGTYTLTLIPEPSQQLLAAAALATLALVARSRRRGAALVGSAPPTRRPDHHHHRSLPPALGVRLEAWPVVCQKSADSKHV
jgi:hypothetical protein